ncbi:MAG: GatB/YqeY domain-containing protein [bacterium]|nr:GatB/YqeY domain-containing protein [bacterium]
MALLEQLRNEITLALKGGRAFEVGVLRLLTAAAHNRAIEKRGKGLPGQGKGDELTDEEVREVLAKEAKKRKESIMAFTQGNRPELAESEAKELKLILRYLPAELSKEEVRAHVEKLLASRGERSRTTGAVSAEGGFGAVMKEAMKELKGKADATLVSKIIRTYLEHNS